MGLRRECGYTRILKEGKGEQCHTKYQCRRIARPGTPDGARSTDTGNPADIHRSTSSSPLAFGPQGLRMVAMGREQTHVSTPQHDRESLRGRLRSRRGRRLTCVKQLGDVLSGAPKAASPMRGNNRRRADVNGHKMVRRHPACTGSVECSPTSEVLDVKASKQVPVSGRRQAAHLPLALMGLRRAAVSRMGTHRGRWDKVAEEKAELIEAYAAAPACRKRQD